MASLLGGGYTPTRKIGEDATKAFEVVLTLVTNECYSGRWTWNPQLNISTMTAA